jgi:hypothetical protein
MMSTEVLMAAVAEPAGARPVAGDLFAGLDKSGGASFAESFSERVGESALLQKNSSAEEVTTSLLGFRSTLPVKKTDELTEMLDVVKGKTIAPLKISTNGELKSVTGDKIVPPQATAVTEVSEKTAAGGSGLKDVEPSREGAVAVKDVSPDPVPLHSTAAGLTDERPVPHAGAPNENRPLASRSDGIVVQKEIETSGEMKEGVSAKKAVKTQGSTAIPKIASQIVPKNAPKVAGADPTSTSKSDTAPSMEAATPSVIPVVQAVVTALVVPQSGSKAVDQSPSEAVYGMAKPSLRTAPTVDASLRKDFVHGTRAAAMDAGPGVAFTDDQLTSLKPGVGLEKITSVAMPVSTDSDGKTQSVPGMTMAQNHVMTGGLPVNALGAVVSGNTKGDLTSEKASVAEASVHTAGLPVGAREQDGSNVAAASMDGMPRTLTATPTALEVGIQNGTHGWLKVRAEMTDGGVVNASVSAASSAGQEMLHRELPAMTAYLQEEKVAVNAIVVHAPLVAGAESRSSTGTDGTGGQTPQRSNEEGEQQQNVRKSISDSPDEAMTYQGSHGMDEDGPLSLATYASGGSWLSVRA